MRIGTEEGGMDTCPMLSTTSKLWFQGLLRLSCLFLKAVVLQHRPQQFVTTRRPGLWGQDLLGDQTLIHTAGEQREGKEECGSNSALISLIKD